MQQRHLSLRKSRDHNNTLIAPIDFLHYNDFMSLNCNEINLILNELNLQGAFIQDIIQPGFDTIAIYTYKNGAAKTVLICTANGACRLNETRRKIPKNKKPLRFMEFLKSKIKGAKILSCEQINFDRIIKMELAHSEQQYKMYIRLWSANSNVILCDTDDNILDTMFRRPQKNEITGGKFSLPEQKKDSHIESISQKFPVRDFFELKEFFSEKNQAFEEISFNQKVDAWYAEHATSLSREALLERAKKWYETHHLRQRAALERLEQKRIDFSSASNKKHFGDLILANAHLTDNSNPQDFLECEDYESGEIVRIKIDPKKSPHENAADYYALYKKELSGAEALKTEIELAKTKIASLEKLYQEILAEKNPMRIEQLLRQSSIPKQKQKKSHPGLDYTVNGWYILVGRDADENDELLRHHVRGNDMWLHTRDTPGGYVFIKYRAGKTIPLDILLDAGNLALYFSKSRAAGKADLYYTEVKHLRRAKNGPKGLVIPTHEKNLNVVLDKNRLARLEAARQENNAI